MKFTDTFTEIVKFHLSVGQVPILIGEAGIGKSSFAEGLAKATHTKAFVLPCNQLTDKADLTGARLVPTPDGKSHMQVFYPHAIVQAAIEYARANPRENPILLLDEVNRTSSDVTSAVLTMITLGELGKETLPENLRLMVAGNDKGNVTTLDEASLSRFVIYHVEPDAHTLVNILGATINPWVRETLLENPQLVFEKSAPNTFAVEGSDDDDDQNGVTAQFTDLLDTGDEMLQLTTPRTIDGASRWLNTVPQDKLQEYFQTHTVIGDRETTLLNEILEGQLGNTGFTKILIGKIANALAAGGSTGQVAALTPPIPNCYTGLKSVATVDELDRLIATLTDKEKSGALLYALYERADNELVIKQLAAATAALEGEDMRILMKLGADSRLDQGNIDALVNFGGAVGDNVKMVLAILN